MLSCAGDSFCEHIDVAVGHKQMDILQCFKLINMVVTN